MHTETWLFLYSGYLKNYKNFFKSWARYIELNQVLLILVGFIKNVIFSPKKADLSAIANSSVKKYDVMLIFI